MASHTLVTVLWLLARHLAVLALSFPDVAPLPDQYDIAAAADSLHNQVLQDRLSLEAIGLPPLPNNFGPSLAEVQGSNLQVRRSGFEAELEVATRQLQQTLASERLRQQEASMSTQLDFAAERLASQQQLVSAQLERAGIVANAALGRMPGGTARETASLLALQQTPSTRTSKSATAMNDPLALPQTMAQLWRQKNPALAALLLEPALYGYSMIVWVLIMLTTGISSALCLFGNKLPFGRAGQHLPPLDAEVGAPRLSEPAQDSSSFSYFRYPGSYGSFHEHLGRAQDHHAAPTQMSTGRVARVEEQEEAPGVESWVKVPRESASRSGYVDDEYDGEADQQMRSIRNHTCGYVDER